MHELLAFVGEHPVLTVVAIILIELGVRDIVVAWRGS